jgi:hypothetical protein
MASEDHRLPLGRRFIPRPGQSRPGHRKPLRRARGYVRRFFGLPGRLGAVLVGGSVSPRRSVPRTRASLTMERTVMFSFPASTCWMYFSPTPTWVAKSAWDHPLVLRSSATRRPRSSRVRSADLGRTAPAYRSYARGKPTLSLGVCGRRMNVNSQTATIGEETGRRCCSTL